MFFAASLMMVWFSLCSIIYLFTKEESFKYYAVYTFFLAGFAIYKMHPIINGMDITTYDGIPQLNWPLQLYYNSFYLLFGASFLNLKVHLPKLNKVIRWFVLCILVIGTVYLLFLHAQDRSQYFDRFFLLVFLPLIEILSFYTLYKSLFLPTKLKYFMVSASLIYMTLAFLSLYLSFALKDLFGLQPLFYFNLGIILESTIFALGLGYKIFGIYKAKNAAQKKLITQLQATEEVRKEANERLQQEVTEKTKEVAQLIQKQEEQARVKLRMEYEQEIMEMNLTSLRNQMNPHFIFNALNAIKSAIISDRQGDAVSYLNKFSKVLREVLKNSENEAYTIQEEMDTLTLYVNLENIRFENKIAFSIDNQGELNLRNFLIPPLLLQPLLENAIWHGLSLKEGARSLSICIMAPVSDHIQIDVEDNGIGRERAQEIKAKKVFQRDSLGVKLTQDRLRLFAQKREQAYDMQVIDLYDEVGTPLGTRVSLKVPVRKTVAERV
jgi:sensor histidine kinase YesM